MNRRLKLVGALVLLAGIGLALGMVKSRPPIAFATPSIPATAPAPAASATGVAVDPGNPWLSADAVAYAVHLRKTIGLRSEEDWVRFVATVPGAVDNVVRYSIPMTDQEVLDVARLNANRDLVLADLEQFRAAHVAAWGGYYLDGDLITVLLIDPTGALEREMRASVPPPLAVKPARWSFEALTNLSLVVSRDAWLQANYELLTAGADVEHNAVGLEVASKDPDAIAKIEAHFNLGDELFVTIGSSQEGGPPNG